MPPRLLRSKPLLRLLVLALLLATAVEAALPKKLRKQIETLPPVYQEWLAGVELLISESEVEAFLELTKDYQRDAFIERFWRSRDPYPSTTRNELRDRWDPRVEEARRAFGDLSEDRSRVFLLNGPPDAQIDVDCTELWPIEVWYYQRAENLGNEIVLLFYQQGGLGRFRLWYPTDELGVLVKFPGPDAVAVIEQCRQSEIDAIAAAYRMVRVFGGGMGFTQVLSQLMDPPSAPSGEWISSFNAYSTDLPEDAAIFPAQLEIEYPSRHQSRTVVQGILTVRPDDVGVSTLTDYGSTYNFVLTGEVIRDDKLFDSFRYRFNLPASEVTGDSIPLIFERFLRPGDYEVILKLEDLNGERVHRQQRQISVPLVEAAPPAPADPETARLLAEANAAISSGETTLKIVEPRGDLHTGMLRIDTLSTGRDIAEVVFSLDGQPLLTKRVPPWSVEVDLGSLPRMRTLTAVARDEQGRELARDEREINAGSHRFDVRLVEPRRGRRYERSLRAEARVDVPEGGVVERVEFYLNETLVATLYQPPYTQPLVLASAGELAYVRAVAYQPDGNFVEDTVFINAPDYMENLEVQFVELYITVLDEDRHPVLGLEASDFTVLEDGVEQEPRRFDQVTNLPIHAGILLDVSASMEESLDVARQAALAFFEQVVRPQDRAALMTFNDHPNLAVKFTNEMVALAGGLAGLKAERGTALYDSLVFALYYFNGIKGQRALVLLSDGKDEHSRFAYEDTLEYARRAGVAIYTIGLDLPRKQHDVRKKLKNLAEETGGRSFFVDAAAELPAIYEVIQRELRSRYYLAYQSSNTSEEESFRTIEVEVDGKGLEAKTLRGYYP